MDQHCVKIRFRVPVNETEDPTKVLVDALRERGYEIEAMHAKQTEEEDPVLCTRELRRAC